MNVFMLIDEPFPLNELISIAEHYTCNIDIVHLFPSVGCYDYDCATSCVARSNQFSEKLSGEKGQFPCEM